MFTIFIGTYSQSIAGMSANGEGIYSCTVDQATGAFGVPVLAAECTNPSYLALDPQFEYLYAVKEVFAASAPAVLAMAVDKRGLLKTLNSQAVPGELPCHVALDHTHRLLATAQYWSGDICLYRLASDGTILPNPTKIQRKGNGPNSSRQEGPHAHFVHFLTSETGDITLVITDLGTDSVAFYPITIDCGDIIAGSPKTLSAPEGAGPRHIAFTKNADMAFVVNELQESVLVLISGDQGDWLISQKVQVFPELSTQDGACAAIRISPDERHVYVSGRCQSRVACFSVDCARQALERQGDIATGGEGPRDFAVSPDGTLLVVANQSSNSLTSFYRDPISGLLKATGHSVELGSPVCVQFG